tara:strand:+ start:1688 stop:2926 length:1239 start_codon:yes stop_codon:yes gene_type:complete
MSNLKNKQKVCVIGLGYIGLPTAALISNNGYTVVGYDNDLSKVELINKGIAPIEEPGLQSMITSSVERNLLKAFSEPIPSDIYIICVPTPFTKKGKIPQPDVTFIFSAIEKIAPFLKANDILILESTSPVGTTNEIYDTLKKYEVDVNTLHVAYCPERVLPGNIMKEIVSNDRIVGGVNNSATRQVATFYRNFVKGAVLETDAKTAELCKLTENSFRDVNIAFANELSLICANEDIDVWNLIDLANHHPRVNILSPGVGVGGHCIAVDPWFIVARDQHNSPLIRTAREVNDNKIKWAFDQIVTASKKIKLNENSKLTVGCFGLSFKPNVDDLRQSPALDVAKKLLKNNFKVLAVEPNIKAHSSFDLVDADYAIKHSDILVLLVKHDQFLEPRLFKKIKNNGAIDFCGILKNG